MQDIIDYVFEWNNESSKNGLERLIEDRCNEAEEKAKIKIAKNMLNLNISLADIEKSTGLSKSQIESIKR